MNHLPPAGGNQAPDARTGLAGRGLGGCGHGPSFFTLIYAAMPVATPLTLGGSEYAGPVPAKLHMISSVKDTVDALTPAARSGGSQTLAADLLAAVSAIRRIARRAARGAWHQQPLAPAQSELLRLAAARPGISVADAAHELRLAPNTVSTLVGRLAAEGLLNRGRAVSDGRSVRLTVTDKATQRIAEWRDLRADLAARALDRLPAGDLQVLADAVPALLRLAAELDEQYKERAAADRDWEPGEDAGRGPTITGKETEEKREQGPMNMGGGGAAAQPDADGGTACLACIARTGAPRGAAPPHSVTIQACSYMYKS